MQEPIIFHAVHKAAEILRVDPAHLRAIRAGAFKPTARFSLSADADLRLRHPGRRCARRGRGRAAPVNLRAAPYTRQSSRTPAAGFGETA